MSHELRTPLNAILGFTEMLSDELYGEVPAAFREPLADIQTNGKHLLRLINDVLDLSKIEAGPDGARAFRVLGRRGRRAPCARRCARSLRKRAWSSRRAPTTACRGYCTATRSAITQCLLNLAGNALKFTRRGSISIRAARDGEFVRYSVSDTGIGIPDDQIGTLFTEFQQLNATITREFGGTGLGLSITKKFVEMHGGRIWVESRLNEGSTFYFTIPLNLETVRAA